MKWTCNTFAALCVFAFLSYGCQPATTSGAPNEDMAANFTYNDNF